MRRIFKEVVPDDRIEVFKNYKYAGSDNSILYQYAFSPFADYIINNHMPPTVALNN